MTKTAGLGDRLYLNGYNLSGDSNTVGLQGGPTLFDTTNITQDAISRDYSGFGGEIDFTVYHNPTNAHIALAELPTGDVIATYLNGADPGQCGAGIVAKQPDYPVNRAADGSIIFPIRLLSGGSPLEWGRGYIGGTSRTDSSATVGGSVDDGAATTTGFAAYLHVMAFSGTSSIITVEHSSDNGVGDPWSTLVVFSVIAPSVVPSAQRVTTSATTTVKRYVRCRTAGAFSLLTFHVLGTRNANSFTEDNMPTINDIYVADYGAVGDDSTNDTTALQSALNAAVAGNVTNALGNTVHLAPNKNYKITSALTWPSNVNIDGHGSSIHQTTASANALVSTDGAYLGLRNITIRGPVSGSPSSTGKGIVCQRSVNANVRGLVWSNVVVHSFGGDGIELSNPITSSLAVVEARSNGGHGFDIHGVPAGAAGTSLSLDGCFGNGNIKAGYLFNNMVYCCLSGCAAESNGIGYELVSCQAITFSGCGAESQVDNSGTAAGYAGYSWKVNGGIGVSLTSCWAYDQPSIALWVTGSAVAVVASVFTENTPQAGATYCIKTDAGSSTTLIHISNSKPLNLLGTTLIVNDGGGLSIPGYGYFGSTLFSEGLLSTGSNLQTSAAGFGLKIKEGSNAKMGTATLTAGAATVTNTSVTANSRIFLTAQATGGTAGALRVSARTAGTSFTITSTSGTDTSTVAWLMVEPSP